jgi:hypothetical protein
MFGISAFAQSPFASLGGTAFPVDLAESMTFTDVYAGPVAFQGLYDESFALADSDGGGSTFDFFGTVAENYSLDDQSFGNYDVLVSQSDSFNLTDDVIGNVDFVGVLTDSVTFTDDYIGAIDFVGLDTESMSFSDIWAVLVDFAATVAETNPTRYRTGAGGLYWLYC